MDEFEKTKPPTVLDYGKSKPLGYKAIQKLTRFFPISALPNTDIVRFIINSNGYWDPYSSYLRFTCSVKTPGTPFGATVNEAGDACQLDNSASSLIQTLSFIQNGVELERIDRYEVLASMLNDMFFTKEQRAQRAHQGFGTGLPQTLKGLRDHNEGTSSPTVHWTCTGDFVSNSSAINLQPNIKASLLTGHAAINTIGSMDKPFICPATIASNGSTPILASAYQQYQAAVAPELSLPEPYFDGAAEPILTGTTVHEKNKITFCIPIISGIFGVLMPADEIKYIPMQFFQNLEMNFRLNPYAFHNLDPSNASGRNFQVDSCELFVNIIHFAPEINNSIAAIVKERGLYLHTCSYYQGPSHMIPANGSFETYPINMSFKSLRTMLWSFIPTDYRSKSYIREIRRKALDLKSAQVRIGGDLYPTFPVGNLSGGSSGNPRSNADFIVNTYKAMGRLHDTVNDSLVNSYTFCTGNTLTSTDYITANSASPFFCFPRKTRGYNESVSSVQLEDPTNATAGGNILCSFAKNNWLVNQIIPRAVYGIDLDTITSDDSVISGVNTLINKPFELLLEGNNSTAESCEVVMFMYYDMVIMVDTDYTVKYLGRGG